MSLLILLEVYLHIILEKFLTDIADQIRLAHLAGSVYEKNLIRLTNQKLLQSLGKFPE